MAELSHWQQQGDALIVPRILPTRDATETRRCRRGKLPQRYASFANVTFGYPNL